MPCLNSSGKVASEASSTPSARKPFQVKARVTHRLLDVTDDSTSAADCTLSRRLVSQALPPATSRKETNSYCPVSAGVRVSRRCWMSLNSSMVLVPRSLHLVEHVRECRLQLESLLDLVRGHIRILSVLQEARPLVLPDELDERRRV